MKRLSCWIVLAVLLAVGASASAQNVTIVKAFLGDVGPGPKDNPDNSGAVGWDYVVDFTDANFVVHDKKSGKIVLKLTQTEFWKAAKPGFDIPVANDPRMLYDPLTGRWFAVAAEAKGGSVGFLAVSGSSDPTKGWRAVKLPMKPTDPGMKLGLDRNGVYVAFTELTGNTHTMHTCYAIPKTDAAAEDGPSLANLQTFPKLEMECFPAMDLDPKKAHDAPEVLLCHEFPVKNVQFSKLYMYRITWAGKTASLSKVQEIPLEKTYIAPNGGSLKNQAAQPAPGLRLRADEARRTTCVYAQGGSLFTCNEAKRTIDSRPGIFWCEVRASDGALLQEGFVDSPDCDYLAPSLAVDAGGNVGIGCTRTSEKEFPSAVVMIRAAADPKNTMGPPVVAMKGTAVFASNKANKFGIGWGNYNATCVDPADPTVLWTSQEFATSGVTDRYDTCWVAFKLK